MPKSNRPRPEMHAAIIEAASHIFARYGLSKTTVDDIAKAVHMGKSSLYYYFQSKEEIFKVVLEKELGAFVSRVKVALARAETPQEKFRAYTITRMQCLKELINVYSAFRDDYLQSYAFIQQFRAEYDRQEVELVRTILAEGVQQGDFQVKDPALTSATIVTVVKGLEYSWAIQDGGVDLEKNINTMLEVLFYGLINRKNHPK